VCLTWTSEDVLKMRMCLHTMVRSSRERTVGSSRPPRHENQGRFASERRSTTHSHIGIQSCRQPYVKTKISASTAVLRGYVVGFSFGRRAVVPSMRRKFWRYRSLRYACLLRIECTSTQDTGSMLSLGRTEHGASRLKAAPDYHGPKRGFRIRVDYR
jgi:hypothetical protein